MMTISTIGRLTEDLVQKTGEKCGVFVNFSIAVNEGVGEHQTVTFFECTAFGRAAESLIKRKAKKSSLINVTGKFSKSDFTRKNGQPGYSLNILVHDWDYIPGSGGKKDNNGGSGNGSGNAQPSNPEAYQPGGCYDEYPYEETDFDDDLTF